MTIASAILSETGPRDENDDCAAVWALPGNRLGVAIADGLGGHFGGGFAANLAVEHFHRAVDGTDTPNLGMVAREIHAAIGAEQEKRPQWHEMATTLSAGGHPKPPFIRCSLWGHPYLC